MGRFILFIFFLTYSIPSFSLTAEDLIREYASIMKHCISVGFYKCENKNFLSGSAKGVFYKPIQMQHVNLMDQRYKKFVKENYPNNFIQFSLIKTTMDFSSVPTFNVTPFRASNIVDIKPMNSDKTIFKFVFKTAPPLFLTNEGNGYRIAIHPDDQKLAIKTKQYKIAYIAMLKANILRYHIIEAQILKLNRSTFNKSINEALAPLVKWTQGNKMPKKVQKYIKRDIKEIRKFYAPIYTDKKARKIIMRKMNK